MPGSYVGLHLSPQVSSSVVYGRSPLVSPWGMEHQDSQQSSEIWGVGKEEEKPTHPKNK